MRPDNARWCGCVQLSEGNLFLEMGSKNLVWQDRLRVALVQNWKLPGQLIISAIKLNHCFRSENQFSSATQSHGGLRLTGAVNKSCPEARKQSKIMYGFLNTLVLSSSLLYVLCAFSSDTEEKEL